MTTLKRKATMTHTPTNESPASKQRSISSSRDSNDSNEDERVLTSRLVAFALAWNLPVDILADAVREEQERKKRSRGEATTRPGCDGAGQGNREGIGCKNGGTSE